MKRFVLLLICATVFVCLLAVPAADAKGQANRQTYRPPVDATMVWGPMWFEYSGRTRTFADVSWHQASDPVYPANLEWQGLYESVPIEKVTYFWSQWEGVNYGFMRNVPNSLLVTVDIAGPGDFEQHFVPGGDDTNGDGEDEVLDSKRFWTGPHIFDQFWADFWYDSNGFNLEPSKDLGALFYDQNLMLPIGPFPEEGRYDVHVSWVSARPLNELIAHGQFRHSPAGAFAYDYTFSIDVE
jgi:hypothetical protein